MTEKQAMNLVYNILGKVALIERNDSKNIYSSGGVYMVALLDGDSSSISPVFQTLEEAQSW